ncbi:MAG: glycosyltransferase [Roseibacillus sp.]|nr:glycosyltransferase [Roseibacillus sp.]
MEMSLWIVTGLSLLCWLVPWVMFVRFRRVPAGCGEGREDVRISIVVPARNEEDNIGGLLHSLREYDLHEVIVVDDQSEDETAAVAARQGARVVHGQPPPQGWLGKPWACSQGAQVATGDWLLFLDADTRFIAGGFERLAGLAKGEPKVHSVCPYHCVRAPYEQLSAFFNVIMILGMNAFTLRGEAARKIGLFGQVMLVSREHYDLVEGHSLVKGEVLENFHLSRHFAVAGIPRRCWLGKNTITMRMFPGGVRDLVAGWSKGAVSGARNTASAALAGVSVWMSGLFMSAVPICFAALASPTLAAAMGLLYLLWVFQCAYLFRSAGTYSFLTALLFPVGLLFYQAVFFQALWRKRNGGTVRWKGRHVA